jgi:hypothetical protein
LHYDDGSADFGFVAGPGVLGAVRFSVSSRMQVLKLKFYVWGEMKYVRVHVLDTNQNSIYSRRVMPSSGWFEVNISGNNVFVSGDFYVGWQWISESPNGPWLGVDNDPPYNKRSYLGSEGNLFHKGSGNPNEQKEDYMIRVEVRAAAEEREGGWEIRNVDMSGRGSYIEINPGEEIRVSLDYHLWNPDNCPACIQQIVIGLGDEAKYCAYNGIPGTYPGESGRDLHTIRAPGSSGTYSLIAANDYQYNCTDAMNRYPQQGEKTTIATIRVFAEEMPSPEINFRADQTNITAGECTTLRWDVEYVQAVYLDGTGVTGHGTRRVCPAQTTTYTLRVVTADGDVYRTVTITVSDRYEPDNNISQAKLISPRESQVRSIIPANDVDWVKFTLNTNSQVMVWTSGPSGDTRIWLYDSDGRELAFDDDSGDGYFSKIERNLTSGTYYVKIDEYRNNNQIPSYQIQIAVTPQVSPPQPPPVPDIARISNVACGPTDTYFILSLSGQGIPNYYYYEVIVEALGDARITQVMPVVDSRLEERIGRTVVIKIAETILNVSGIGTVIDLVEAFAEEWDRQSRTDVRSFRVSWYDTATQPSLKFLVWGTRSSSGGIFVTLKWARYRNETVSLRGPAPICP